MAEEKKARKSAFKWFRELKSEFKKIVWPSGKQLKNNTAVVLAMVIVMASVIAFFDWGFGKLLGTVVTADDDSGYSYGQEEKADEEKTETEEQGDAGETTPAETEAE